MAPATETDSFTTELASKDVELNNRGDESFPALLRRSSCFNFGPSINFIIAADRPHKITKNEVNKIQANDLFSATYNFAVANFASFDQ